MRIFVTGATGFVGSAIVKELIGAGHEVLGLARSDASAKSLLAIGVKVHLGDIEDIKSLQSGVSQSDGIIHTAFNHDFSKFKANSENDRRAIEAMGSVIAGSERPFIIASPIGILTPGKLASEKDVPPPSSSNPRIATEEAVEKLTSAGVRISVVRLPPSVHGDGDHAFVPALIKIAREKGISVYQDQGNNRWAAVHQLDAAVLFRLAVEKNSAPGTRFHAVAEEGVAFREIAEVIARRLNIPAVSKNSEEAAKHFGWFAYFASGNVPASSKLTQEQLGWIPKQPGLIAELDHGNYFSV